MVSKKIPYDSSDMDTASDSEVLMIVSSMRKNQLLLAVVTD